MLTILRVAVVDITVAERSPSAQVPTNPNGHNLTHLVEQIIELRVGDIEVEVTDVERRRQKLTSATVRCRRRGARVRIRRHTIGSRHRWTLMLNLNLSHLFPKQPSNPSFFFDFRYRNQTLDRTHKHTLKQTQTPEIFFGFFWGILRGEKG